MHTYRCVACTKMTRLDIDLSLDYIGNETCIGGIFTYFFPIIIVMNDTVFPGRMCIYINI